jgi:hypothetical protein
VSVVTGVAMLMMAAIVYQWIDPEGFLAVFVVTELIHLVSELVRKGGQIMAKAAHALKSLAITACDATPSRVPLPTSP